MATHSSILAWRIPWIEGYSPWGHKDSDTTKRLTLSHFHGRNKDNSYDPCPHAMPKCSSENIMMHFTM